MKYIQMEVGALSQMMSRSKLLTIIILTFFHTLKSAGGIGILNYVDLNIGINIQSTEIV